MITALIYVAIVVWVLLALAVAIAIGTAISTADRREQPTKPCCPHDPKQVGAEPVRGEFRAIVIAPRRDPDRARLDVKL